MIKELTDNLLQKFANSMLGELSKIIEVGAFDRLFKVYRVFDYSPWGNNFFSQKYSDALYACVKEKSEAVKSVEFVAYLLGLHRALQTYGGADPCQTNKKLKKLSVGVIQNYIASSRSEKLCAIYIDHHIKNLHNQDESAMATFNEHLIELLKLQKEASHFEFHYKHYMKKRLLSISNPEIGVLKTLKAYLDEEQVDHMELALLDVKSSLAIKSHFDNFLQRNEQAHLAYTSSRLQEIEFTVKVISFTFWDIPSVVSYSDHHFPPEAVELHRLYESFYKSKHSERLLIWLYGFGNATVTLNPPSGGPKKELTLSKLQALLCLYFNKRDRITLEYAKIQTGLGEDVLLPEILGLVASDVIVVSGRAKKEVLSAGFSPSEEIVLAPNLDKLKRAFQVTKIKKVGAANSPSNQFALTASAAERALEQSGGQNDSVSVLGNVGGEQELANPDDKQFQEFKKVRIESCTMRVMKSNKSMEFESLFTTVCSLLTGKFSLLKRDFQEVLDRLLQNEYLVRSWPNPNVLLYSESDETQNAGSKLPSQQPKLTKRTNANLSREMF